MNAKPNLTAKSELKGLSIALLLVFIIFKIAFYKEGIINVLKFSVAFCYFSLVPGYIALYSIRSKISNELRMILAFPLGLAIYAFITYYLNLVVSLQYLVFLPAIVFIIYVWLVKKRNKD